MSGMSINTVMNSFFDRKAVLDVVGRKRAMVLSKGGAMIRSAAQKSLRYASGISAGGEPPHAHRTTRITKKDKQGRLRTTKAGAVRMYAVSPLREFLYFAFDFGERGMVVGPVKLRGKLGDAPAALEHGGMSEVSTHQGRGTRMVKIKPHPYMGPAGLATLPKITGLWGVSGTP